MRYERECRRDEGEEVERVGEGEAEEAAGVEGEPVAGMEVGAEGS